MKVILIALTCLTMSLMYSCGSDDEVREEEHLNVDLDEVPYDSLSSYGFFKGKLPDLIPAKGVWPYDVASPLFSDYAHKERFVYLPEGTTMDYINSYDPLHLPDGAILIKNFLYYTDERNKSLGRRIIETRLLVKVDDIWKPISYQWDTAQTEATRLVVGATVSAQSILSDGRNLVVPAYVLPRELDCRTCHKHNEKIQPIGLKAANLQIRNTYYSEMTILDAWIENGIITGSIDSLVAIPSFHDTSLDPVTRGRAYLDANCGFCHRRGGTANANGLFINWDFDGPDLNRGYFKIPTNYNAPNLQYDIVPGQPEESILFYRMTKNTAPDVMPQIGRSVNHTEGIEIIRTYIDNL